MKKSKAANKQSEMSEYAIDVIFTNSYLRPSLEITCSEHRDSQEKEKLNPRCNPDEQKLKFKYIDSKNAIRKHTAKELVDRVLKWVQNAAECASKSCNFIRKFQSLTIMENEPKRKTPLTSQLIDHHLSGSQLQDRIKEKKKYGRLTDSEKLFIVKEVKLKKRDKKELSKILKVSYSTIRRVTAEMWSEGSKSSKWFDPVRYTKKITKRTQEKIKHFIFDRKFWVTAPQIAHFIKKNTNQEIAQNAIRRYLREDLRFSYKKGTPKPWSIDLDKLRAGRIWYSSELTKQVNQRTLLVNIDETSLSKSTFNNRSWFPKGNSGEVFSIGFKSSISLILAIISEGHYFGTTIGSTVNSMIYKQFLENLEGWLSLRYKNKYDNIILIQDNAPIHRAKIVFKFMESDDYTHAFLPPYTPEYAPVELIFAQIKAHIKRSYQKSLVDLRGNEGVRLVKDGLSRLSRETIIKCWRHSFERLNQDLSRFIHNIKLIHHDQNCS